MAFVPYMVGGFAVDKMMGGNGLKGAALGAGGSFLGPEILASGAAETSTAGIVADATAAEGLATAGMGGMQIGSQPAFGQMMAEGISPFTPLGTPVGQSTGLLGQEISNQALNSSLTGVPGFFEQQLNVIIKENADKFRSDGMSWPLHTMLINNVIPKKETAENVIRSPSSLPIR